MQVDSLVVIHAISRANRFSTIVEFREGHNSPQRYRRCFLDEEIARGNKPWYVCASQADLFFSLFPLSGLSQKVRWRKNNIRFRSIAYIRNGISWACHNDRKWCIWLWDFSQDIFQISAWSTRLFYSHARCSWHLGCLYISRVIHKLIYATLFLKM